MDEIDDLILDAWDLYFRPWILQVDVDYLAMGSLEQQAQLKKDPEPPVGKWRSWERKRWQDWLDRQPGGFPPILRCDRNWAINAQAAGLLNAQAQLTAVPEDRPGQAKEQ